MSWIHFPSVNITLASQTVNVGQTISTGSVKVGDALLFEGNAEPQEITAVFSTQLEIRKPLTGATLTGVKAYVIPTAGDFNQASTILREATTAVFTNFEAMEKWWTELGTVTFTGFDGAKHTVKTVKQVELDAIGASEERVSASTTLTTTATFVEVFGGTTPIVITPNAGMEVAGYSFLLNVSVDREVSIGSKEVTVSAGNKVGLIRAVFTGSGWKASVFGPALT